MKRSVILVGLALVVAAAAAAWFLTRTSPASAPQSTAAQSTAPQSTAISLRTTPSTDDKVTAIKGATVIDGSGKAPITDAVILIQGSRIAAVGPVESVGIPANATVIDATGKFVIPGLADMHNHLRNGIMTEWENPRPNLSRLLGSGITMTFAPSMQKDAFVWLKTNITNDPTAPYAHFWGTGPIITAKESAGVDYGPTTPSEAQAVVAELKAANVDGVKLFYDDMSWLLEEPRPMLPPEVMAATIEAAHKQGLKVYVHAPILKHAKAVLKAGADGLLHGIISDPVDDEFISLMKRNGAVYVSTLALYESTSDLGAWGTREASFDDHGNLPQTNFADLQSPETIERMHKRWPNRNFVKQHLPTARKNLKQVFDAGVPVVAGTDTGIFGVVLPVASHLELVLMTEAGLDVPQALQTATVNAARMVGREKDLGTIEPGKLADLVILDANPLTNISNTRLVNRVVKGGVVYEPSELFRLADLPHDQFMRQLGRQ